MATSDDIKQGKHSSSMNRLSEEVTQNNDSCRVPRTEDLTVTEQNPELDTLDLVMTFITSLMERDYPKSLQLCKQVIDREPENTVALQFYPILLSKSTEYSDEEDCFPSGSVSSSSISSNTDFLSSDDLTDHSSDSSDSAGAYDTKNETL